MSYYGSSRRRKNIPLRVLGILAIVAVIGLLAFQLIRGQRAIQQTDSLKQQISTLEEEKANLEKQMPAASLQNAMSQPSYDYQSKYPEMVVAETPVIAEDKANTAYLTFDDGPSKNTPVILDALKANGAHATFFIVGKEIAGKEAILKRIVDEGNTIAVHTFSHDYKGIYASVDAFLDDFNQIYTAIHDATGVYPTVFRFPGGSINAYNYSVYKQIIAEMLRRGFLYYDWNVSSNDAAGTSLDAPTIANNVINGVKAEPHPIVLMHDAQAKVTTASAIPTILTQLKNAGYAIEGLNNTVRPTMFGYKE